MPMHREIAGVGRVDDSRDAVRSSNAAHAVLVEQAVPLIVTVVVMLAVVRRRRGIA